MGEHNFDVNFRVFRAEAKAAHEAEQRAYREHEKSADRAAKSAEAAAGREAAARKRAAAEALTADEVAARAKEELIRRTNAAAIKAAADAGDAARAARMAEREAARQAVADAREAARQRVEAERQAAAEARELARREATDRRARSREIREAAVAATREAREQARARAADARDAAKAERLRIREVADEQRRANREMEVGAAAGSKFVDVLGGIGSAVYGISGLSSVVDMVAQSFQRARDQAEAAGKWASDYRAALKELAFLKGANAPDSAVMRADIEFRKQTLQDATGARAVQEAFLNKAGVATDTRDTRRKMTAADRDAAMVFAGRMHSQFGGDAESYGNLAGMIPSMESADRVTAADIKRRMTQLNQIGQLGGASPSQFAGAMSGASYLATTGAYRDPARMAAVGSALSIATPSEIGQGLDQMHRLTTGSLKDVTGPKGSLMSPAEYLKGLGATDQMDDLDILKLMFGDVEREEAKARDRGEKLNISSYLTDRGYANIQDKGRFSQLYGSRADLVKTFEPLAGKLPTLAEAENPFEAFRQSAQGGKQASDLMQDRTQLVLGGGAQEYYQRLEAQAFAALQQKGDVSGSIGDWRSSRTLRGAMVEIQRQELIAAGQDAAVRFHSAGVGSASMSDPLESLLKGPAGSKQAADAFYGNAVRIKQAGGDPMGGNSRMMREYEANQVKFLDKMDALERAITGVGAKLAPAAVEVVRPGGANAGLAR